MNLFHWSAATGTGPRATNPKMLGNVGDKDWVKGHGSNLALVGWSIGWLWLAYLRLPKAAEVEAP